VLEFWYQAIDGLRLWLAGNVPQPTTAEHVAELMAKSEWAELAATRTELYLSLCWGDPNVCHCDWGRPDSGCDRIIATPDEPSGIKV
jgi:hypothetical protein